MKKTMISATLLLAVTICLAQAKSVNHFLAQHTAHYSLENPFFVEPLLTQLRYAEPDSLWQVIRRSFTIPRQNMQHRDVVRQVQWFKRHPEHIKRVFERSEPFLYYIQREIKKKNLPGELILVPVIESAFLPQAHSSGGAAGIWQIIPLTARRLGLRRNYFYDGRRDIQDSTQAALDYLEYLNHTFHGDWLLTLAAYNAGEGTVQRAIRRNVKRGKPTDFWSLRLPKETRGYVPRWLALKQVLVEHITHDRKDILPAITPHPKLTPVTLRHSIKLSVAARLANISLRDMNRYNPGYSRGMTEPHGPTRLLIPVRQAAHFKRAAHHLSPEHQHTFEHYRVQPGDTLSELAHHCQISVKTIVDINKLKNHHLAIGQHLLLPTATTRRTIPSAKKIYTVMRGDSLWKVGKQHAVSINQLVQWNDISRKHTLKVGQKIIIWQTDPGHNTDMAPA